MKLGLFNKKRAAAEDAEAPLRLTGRSRSIAAQLLHSGRSCSLAKQREDVTSVRDIS
jgi:hypothetical protein